MNPFTQRVCDLLPNQVHRKAIETDAYLRVKGAPRGSVYAIGDCATVSKAYFPFVSVSYRFVLSYRLKHRQSTTLWNSWMNLTRTRMVRLTLTSSKPWVRFFTESSKTFTWISSVKRIKRKIPMAEAHLVQVCSDHRVIFPRQELRHFAGQRTIPAVRLRRGQQPFSKRTPGSSSRAWSQDHFPPCCMHRMHFTSCLSYIDADKHRPLKLPLKKANTLAPCWLALHATGIPSKHPISRNISKMTKSLDHSSTSI